MMFRMFFAMQKKIMKRHRRLTFLELPNDAVARASLA